MNTILEKIADILMPGEKGDDLPEDDVPDTRRRSSELPPSYVTVTEFVFSDRPRSLRYAGWEEENHEIKNPSLDGLMEELNSQEQETPQQVKSSSFLGIFEKLGIKTDVSENKNTPPAQPIPAPKPSAGLKLDTIAEESEPEINSENSPKTEDGSSVRPRSPSPGK